MSIISDEDKHLFRNTVGRVRKIKKQGNLAQHPRPKKRIKIHKALRGEMNFVDLMSDDTAWINTDPTAEMRFLRSGAQPKMLRDLAAGKIYPDDAIDLHGLTASSARDALQSFLFHALKRNLFCLRIVHGQGNSSKGDPVIRGLIDRWLRLQMDVLAFANPPQKYGGRGVTLCVLRSQYPFDNH